MKKIFFVLFIIFLLTDTDTYSSEIQDMLHHRSWWIEKYGLVGEEIDPLAARAEMVFQRVSVASDKTGNGIPRLLIINGSGSPWVTSIRDRSVILTHGALRVCYTGVSKGNGDSRLAFVLGHELAHLSNDEYWHAFAFADINMLLDDTEISEELEAQLGELRDIGHDKSTADKIIRSKELRADSYGMISMTSAGYDPRAIIDNDNINFFEDWISQTKRNITYEDSHHPDPKVRAEFLRLRLDDVVKLLDCFTFGVTLYQIGRYEDAILLFDTFAEQFPGREVFSNLGLSYYQIAIKALSFCDADLPRRFKLSTFIDPETYAVRFRGLGESDCFKDKEFLRYIKRAIKYLQLAVDKDHTYLPARINLSSALIMSGEYSRAMGVADEVLEIDRENPEALNNKAVALYLFGLSSDIDTADNAIEILRKATVLNNNFGSPVYNIAAICSERGGNTSASNKWQAFLKIEPTGEYANAARKNLGLVLNDNDVTASFSRPEPPIKPGEEIRGELEQVLEKMKVREFSIGGLTIEIYDKHDLRILARDFVVEVVEEVYDKEVRVEEFKTEYGKPLRVRNKYGGAILVYDNFAVDVIDGKVRKVIYFNKKQGKWYG
jgi:tetratricopeptide (TPR) repeat protein